MIEMRKTLMAPFCEANVRAARAIYKHCPDCGAHTRMLVIQGLRSAGEGALQGPPPAQIFYCDRCAVGFLVIYDPKQEVAIEQGLPQLLEEAGVLTKQW